MILNQFKSLQKNKKIFILVVLLLLWALNSCNSSTTSTPQVKHNEPTTEVNKPSEVEPGTAIVEEESITEDKNTDSQETSDTIKEEDSTVDSIDSRVESLIKSSDYIKDYCITNDILTINLELSSLSSKSAIKLANSEASKLFSTLFSNEAINSINEVRLCFWGDFLDNKGNTTNEIAIKIFMLRNTSDTINYDNFNYENLPSIADTYYSKL